MSFKYVCKHCTFEGNVSCAVKIKKQPNRTWIWKCLKCGGDIKLSDISYSNGVTKWKGPKTKQSKKRKKFKQIKHFQM